MDKLALTKAPISVLSRRSLLVSAPLTPGQKQAEHLVENFVEQSSDWKSLAAMMVGGLAYRMGKMGVMASVGVRCNVPLQKTLSVISGLTSEVTAFEFANRVLSTVGARFPRPGLETAGGETPPLQNQSPDTDHPSPNLWSWSGPSGWKEGLLSSLVTFGALKGFGRLAQGQNIIVQNLAQDLGMVTGHQLLNRVGWEESRPGGFLEQMTHAQAMNFQIGAGMALGHVITEGKLLALERGLGLSLPSSDLT